MIQQLINFLKGNAGITALVGNRVSPEWIDNPVYPSLTVQTVGGVTRLNVDGTKQLHESHYQIDCWAERYPDAHALRTAVLTALDGFRGSMGGVRVAIAVCESRLDLSDMDGDRRTRRISLDFEITHEE